VLDTKGDGMTLFDQLKASIQADTLDEAVAPIQAILGQKDGGFAGIFFSHLRDKDWVPLSPKERHTLLSNYVTYEIEQERTWGGDEDQP